ncbi:hypothetical protein [Sphingomonas sp. SRS2]|uniref:hypothetical protein n=1 Tax=Sphingomonas sp. SRS2 TaxID=133190 RepID=UPI0006184A12|nr:hypothetical protein [Sphingomonas sp. SRS2]KKC27017.1 hypothetical protein WP12_06040 [Sphingomonas sp. SRS2]
MIWRKAIAVLLPIVLSGCSYSYDLLAVVWDGHLTFVVDPTSAQRPSCLRYVDVTADIAVTGSDGKRYDPAPGTHTAWLENIDYDDDCLNKFPLMYGSRLKGRHRPEGPLIVAMPLRRGVVYGITTTTGATGYGGGRFVIHADGRVENLRRQTTDSGNETTPKP